MTTTTERAGCLDLLSEVQNRIKPRIHVFGHIHEDYGITYDGTTLFINASNLDLAYRAVNPCVVVDLPHDRSKPAVVIQPNCKVKGSDLKQWFHDHECQTLARYMDNVTDVDTLPSGNDLLSNNSFIDLMAAMFLHRDKSAQEELRDVIGQMYVEAFE
jgi:hypothetical protein